MFKRMKEKFYPASKLMKEQEEIHKLVEDRQQAVNKLKEYSAALDQLCLKIGEH